MFTSKLNPMTGKLDWELQSDDYDYQQELARAGFADMLHDYDRNIKYFAGLKKVIAKLKSENKQVHVLDIGTGTGLLSMMAVHAGADRVTACEAFQPMIKVAKKCIEENEMKDKIEIIEKRSTDIVVGVDMDQKANVLVTEVFDTELIGEGAIATFNHALKNLLIKDCYVIPDNAIMYVQIVESKVCRNWNWLNLEDYNFFVPDDYKNPAGDSICDIQLDQFEGMFKPLTKPLVAFKFSFSGKEPLLYNNKSSFEEYSIEDGQTDGIFMWWECNMDWENEIVMSCAPKWANDQFKLEFPWRDHWMQAVYFPKNTLNLKKGDHLNILCNHDEYSLWFDVYDDLNNNQTVQTEQSLGNTIVSRNRLAQINNSESNEMFTRLFKKYEDSNKNVLIANDDLSISPFIASTMNFKQVYVLETNRMRINFLKMFIKKNKIENKLTIVEKMLHELDSSDLNSYIKPDLIFSELAFSSSHLPWENMYFYYGVESLLKSQLDNKTDKKKINPTLLPYRISIYAIAVQFEHLHKIRSPVEETCGFSLKEFDRVILEASKQSDGFMEPHPLWEYPSYPLTSVHEIFQFDYNKQNLENCIRHDIAMPIKSDGVLNGVALWSKIEYDENDKSLSLNTGLLKSPIDGIPLSWSQNYKQAVHIFDNQYPCFGHELGINKVVCQTNFTPKSGSFNINFKVIKDKF